MDLDNVIEEKLAADADFQTTLEALSDEEKATAIAEKKAELTKQEFAAQADARAKAEKIAADQKARAEKAEKAAEEAAKGAGGVKPPEGAGSAAGTPPSLQDIRALQDVHDDDVDHITQYAKFKGVSIADAKRLPEMQAYIKMKEEERRTAAATNVSNGARRTVQKDTHQAILERAEKGDLPESEEDIKKLAEARLADRIAKSQNKS